MEEEPLEIKNLTKLYALVLLKSKDSAILKKCELVLRNSRNLFNKALKDVERKTNITSRTNILDYGLTEGMIDELEDLFNKFKTASEHVGNIVKQETKITEKTKNLVKKNTKLLQKKMDKLMILFESRDPEFHELYQKSRGFIMAEPVKSNSPTPKKTPQKRTRGRRKKISQTRPRPSATN